MKRILVVDDEQDTPLLFQQKFRREIRAGQIDFLFALSGREALEKLESDGAEGVDLAIVDVNMPGMSGLELLQLLNQTYPQLRTYLITGIGDEQIRQLARQYGCAGHLAKPIDFEELKKSITLSGSEGT